MTDEQKMIYMAVIMGISGEIIEREIQSELVKKHDNSIAAYNLLIDDIRDLQRAKRSFVDLLKGESSLGIEEAMKYLEKYLTR